MPSSECVPPPIHIPGLSVAATPFHRSYALMKNQISLWRSGLSYCYQRSESCSLHHIGYPVNRKSILYYAISEIPFTCTSVSKQVPFTTFHMKMRLIGNATNIQVLVLCNRLRTREAFLESPGNLTVPKSYSKI